MASAVTLPPVANQEDWDEQVQLFGRATGEPVQDLDAVTALTLVVWDPDTNTSMLTGAHRVRPHDREQRRRPDRAPLRRRLDDAAASQELRLPPRHDVGRRDERY